jgi:hypothetical protein
MQWRGFTVAVSDVGVGNAHGYSVPLTDNNSKSDKASVDFGTDAIADGEPL